MLIKLREKIRALTEDFSLTSFEVFEYTTSNIFPIATSNITITEVLIDGNELATGETYSYSSTTGKITITRALWTSGEKVQVDFSYNKYSDSELNEYIRAALIWVSNYSHSERDFELESTGIYPTPNNKTLDLIATVASILIKPDFLKKKLPNSEVTYSRMSREQQIKELVLQTSIGIGIMDLITWD